MPKKEDYPFIIEEDFILSWNGLIDNKRIIVPDLLFFVFTVILTIILAALNIDFIKILGGYIKDIGNGVQDGIIGNLLGNSYLLWKFIILSLIFLLVNLSIGIIVDYVKYGMISQVCEGKAASIKKAYLERKNYFLKVLAVKFVSFSIIVVGIACGFLVSGMLMAFISNKTIYGILLLFSILLIGFIVVWILLCLLYVYPIMFLEKRGVIKSFIASIKFFKEHKLKVFLVGLMIILIGYAANFLIQIYSYVMRAFSLLNGYWAIFIPFALLIGFVFYLLYLFIKAYQDLYLFFSYKL